MTRVYNFSSGPAALPDDVLEQAREELPDYRGTGMSVMEMSHRGAVFSKIAEEAEADLRDLLAIPDDYKVLFLQGGATLQFAAVPLNLSQPGDPVDYVLTGSWGKKAVAEAGRFATARIVASSSDSGFDRVPPRDTWTLTERARYLHYTTNETIGGVQFHSTPETDGVPLVADMSSDILSAPLDVSRFGVIYAGAQKNIGPAGLTIVIVNAELLDAAREGTPSMLNYTVHANAGSMSNTPPTYAWYVAGLVFQWLKRRGGLAEMAKVNRRKAEKLYAAIDGSDFYANNVVVEDRSLMNVPFVLANPELDAAFLEKASAEGLETLKGHRSVGGMRASIYNAMPEEGVDALVAFMAEFERTNA